MNDVHSIVPSASYISYAGFPVTARYDNEILLNYGGAVNDSIIVNGDTVGINYIAVDIAASNNATRNGPVHFISDLFEIEQFGAQYWRTDFLEEPVFANIRDFWNSTYEIIVTDFDELSRFDIVGIQYIAMIVQDRGIWDQDYLQVYGDFEVSYTTNPIMPGNYELKARFFRNLNGGATVQFKVDGLAIGPPFPCKNFQNGDLPVNVSIGDLTFNKREAHKVTMESTDAGAFEIFFIEFVAK